MPPLLRSPAAPADTDDEVNVPSLDDFPQGPAEIDVVDPKQTHEFAVAVCAQLAVVGLPSRLEILYESGLTSWLASDATNFGALSAPSGVRYGDKTR